MARPNQTEDLSEFAGPAATVANGPEKPPAGRPQTIPVAAIGPPVVAPNAQIFGSRAAMPQQEYVAGQPFPFLSNYLKALPRYIGDLDRDFPDIYERMLYD